MTDDSRSEGTAMNDPIERRLHTDAELARVAERPAAFEPLLERAVSGRPRRPLRRGTWLAAAAVIALGAAAAVSLLVTHRPSGQQAAGNTRINPMTDAGFTGAVLDADDPRTLYLLVEHGSGSGACDVVDPVAVVTSQDATSVTVAIQGGIVVPASAPASGYFGFSCTLAGYAQVPVRLAAPLGHRTLYSGTDKQQAQPVLDPATVPTPSDVPSGYAAEPVTWEPNYVPGILTSKAPGTDGTWAALRRYRDGTDTLDVRVGRYVTGSGTLEGHAQVAGHRATVFSNAGTLCLTWTETPARAVQVCSTAQPHPVAGASGVVTQPAGAPLDEPALLQVARSLG
jgi:hypothetical protein